MENNLYINIHICNYRVIFIFTPSFTIFCLISNLLWPIVRIAKKMVEKPLISHCSARNHFYNAFFFIYLLITFIYIYFLYKFIYLFLLTYYTFQDNNITVYFALW